MMNWASIGVQAPVGNAVRDLWDGEAPANRGIRRKCYRLAADQNLHLAQSGLGNLYANGMGVEQDSVEAVKWYHKAANYENLVAQQELAKMYANGTGVAKDPVEAAKWCRKVIAHRNSSPALKKETTELLKQLGELPSGK